MSKNINPAFTLAEVLITLAIIGVVAAIAIPSVISNSQQQEFRTGLRKAVSVLNSAITMNMALDGETPYDNANLFLYLQRHMGILKTTNELPWYSYYVGWNGATTFSSNNTAFYTTDGMRFEFDDNRESVSGSGSAPSSDSLRLHESSYSACLASVTNIGGSAYGYNNVCGTCGSYGLKHNPNNTTKVPCAILVDVNGDRKPTPNKVADSVANRSNIPSQKYWVPTPESKHVADIFVVLITEDRAIPYGVTAQKAMYQAQK